MAREMKDSGIKWIGEIPKEWKIEKYKHCFSCSKEIVEKKSESTQLLSLTTKGIKKKSINDSFGKVPDSYDTYQVVKQNDIVMCLFDLDVSAVFSGISPYYGMISPAYKVLSVKENVFPKYADYWFSYIFDGRKYKYYSKNLRFTLNYDEFAILQMLLPSIKEQMRIANHLDTKCAHIDSAIEETRAAIEEYKKLKQAVITQTVTKGIRPNREMKDSGIEWIGEIPKEWNQTKLKRFIAIPVIDGPHESPQLFDSGIPYISATSIEKGKINFDLKRGFISERYCDECDKRYKPKRNDILVIKLGASTGQVALVETDLRFNIWVPLAAVRCDNKTNSKYIYYCFQSLFLLRQMELSWTFGTQQTLGVKAIEQLKFFIPSLNEQSEIVEYLDEKTTAIDYIIEKKEQLISELESYKKSLIYEYVTGKKEVK